MRTVPTVLALAAFTAAAAAGVQTIPLGTQNITTTYSSIPFSGTGTALVRGYTVTGDWTAGSGGPWSQEFQTRLQSGLTGVFDRSMGGTNNGNPYSFVQGGSWWSNGTTNLGSNIGNIRGEYTTFQPANSSFTLGLRQSFAGSNATLSNAAVNLFTDIIPEQSGALDGSSGLYRRAGSVTGIGSGTLGSGTTYRYESYTFTALVDGLHQIGARYTGFDGYLSLYQGAFDPTNAIANIIGVDDDSSPTIGTLGSDMWLNLIGGQSYTVVISHFSATPQTGSFISYVAGPVPAPASLALLGLGGLAASRRRR